MTAKPAALTITIAVLALMAFGWAGAGFAQSAGGERRLNRSDLAAPSQPKRVRTGARTRTRIRVTPRCPYRLESLPYPTPYACDYPGPGYVRQCDAQLVREYRPGGTVVVPVTHCWWERG
jgi:hypothetical protein